MRILAGNLRNQLAWIAVTILAACPLAFSQQSNDLQQQLQELKQTTQELQQRIALLEQQIAKQKEVPAVPEETTASVAEVAAEKAVKKVLFGGSNQVGAKYQGQVPSQPTYDLLQEAETRLEGMQQQFEAHGPAEERRKRGLARQANSGL